MAINGGLEKKMALENLTEWIEDENKLITYKWLSRNLSIHVNEAKWLLKKYISEHGSSNTATGAVGLAVTYCISGLVRGTEKRDGSSAEDVFTVRIVSDKDLATAEQEFIAPISCHVYSVQKSSSSTDINLLCSVDHDLIQKDNDVQLAGTLSGITCAAATVLCQNYKVYDIQPATTAAPASRTVAESMQLVTKPLAKAEVGKSFFGNVKPKSATVTKAKPTAATSKAPDKNANAFFKAQPPKSTTSLSVDTSRPSDVKQECDESSQALSQKRSSQNATDSQNGSSTSASEPRPNKAGYKPVADVCSLVNETSKKRRRIVEASSSEDEDEDANIEEIEKQLYMLAPEEPQAEDLEAASDDAIMEVDNVGDSKSPANVAVSNEVPPRSSVKKPSVGSVHNTSPSLMSASPVESQSTAHCQSTRKLVSKTYMNEEGYIVTEKVWEMQPTVIDMQDRVAMETQSEVISSPKREPLGPATKNQPAAAASQKTAQVKKPAKAVASSKHQASLMNFFKKT